MPMRLQMEQAILSEFQRLPTLHSDFIGLETMLGIDEEIGFEDFLTGAAFYPHPIYFIPCAHSSPRSHFPRVWCRHASSYGKQVGALKFAEKIYNFIGYVLYKTFFSPVL